MSVNGQPLGYDLDGNLLSAPDPLYGGGMTLGYNSRNQLTSASLRGVSAAFTYDAEGVRQTMTTGSGASSTTTYFTSTPHGPLSQVVARYEKSSVDNGGAPMFFDGGAIHWAVYGHGLLYEVAETINGSGKPVESEVLYYHTDQVGSTVAVTNQAQQDVLWVQYDAYGAVTEAVSPMQRDGKPAVRPGLNQVADKLQRALSVTPYLYCGEHGVMTDRTGLIHMRARYYHPGLRRFVNPDPIGFAGGMNWYGYAGGGPVMALDPSGEALWIPAVVIGLYFLGTDTANGPTPGGPTYASNGFATMMGGALAAAGGAGVVASGRAAYTYAAMHPGATMTVTAALDQSGTIAAVGGASALAWNSRPPGVQVAQIGDWFVKTVNPQSNKLMQWWGQQSINAQHKALMQLGDMAVDNFMSNGALYTRSVGQVLGNGSRFTNATSLNAYLEGSKRIGYFNDIQPRNMGVNGKIFDPAIDWVTKSLFYAGGAAAVGGAGYLGYRTTCVR